jgi:hypothetical protein
MVFQNFANMSKTIQPFLEIQNIANQTFEQLIRENMGYWSDNMGANVQYLQMINSKSTNPDALIKTNLGYISNQMARGLEYTRKVSEICESAMREYGESMQHKMESTFAEASSGSAHEHQQHNKRKTS